jgi:hypothetical protein
MGVATGDLAIPAATRPRIWVRAGLDPIARLIEVLSDAPAATSPELFRA